MKNRNKVFIILVSLFLFSSGCTLEKSTPLISISVETLNPSENRTMFIKAVHQNGEVKTIPLTEEGAKTFSIEEGFWSLVLLEENNNDLIEISEESNIYINNGSITELLLCEKMLNNETKSLTNEESEENQEAQEKATKLFCRVSDTTKYRKTTDTNVLQEYPGNQTL